MIVSNYNFENNIISLEDYKIVSFSRSIFEHDWSSIEHVHPYAEIIFTLSGQGKMIINQTKYDLKKGSLIIVNQNCIHTEFSSKDAPLDYAIIAVSNLYFYNHNAKIKNVNNIDENEYQNIASCNFEDDFVTLLKYYQLLEAAASDTNMFSETICKNLVNNIILFILANTSIKLKGTDSADIIKTSLPRKTNTNHTITLIRNYLDKYYSNPITIKDLSEVFFINEYYLIHAFKKIVGFTPIEYLNKVRLNKAKMLIETTDFTILNIAVQTGFNNSAYFSRIFKNAYGYPPSSLKRNSK